jgi:glutamine cyclotransferase
MGNAHDMNGIGYWAKQDRLFVTGKFWTHVYEIKINP